MPLRIRPATAEDVAAILALHRLPHVAPMMSTPTERQVLSGLEDPDARDFIIVQGSAIAGFVRCCALEDWLVEIRRLIAGVPRTGVGRFAMREALHWAFKRQKAHRVFLEVLASNAGARRLYESLGFVLEGVSRESFRHADGTYEDLCAYGLLACEYGAAIS
jgi:RimJ/RimL family protein N-acetyltransferase